MASRPKEQPELNFIINVLVPEQKSNGALAIHCRTAVMEEEKTKVAVKPQRKKKKRCRKTILPQLTEWAAILLAICSSAFCYLAVAAAEMTRRGYYSIGGELILALAVGYIVYRAVGTKNAPAT